MQVPCKGIRKVMVKARLLTGAHPVGGPSRHSIGNAHLGPDLGPLTGCPWLHVELPLPPT